MGNEPLEILKEETTAPEKILVVSKPRVFVDADGLSDVMDHIEK